MHWRAQKYIVEEIVKLIRRIFFYNSSWVNTDIEIVQFSSGSEQLVFEQFLEENEKYPVITVGSNGVNFTNTSLNNIIQSVERDGTVLGERALSMVNISDVDKLVVQLPSSSLNKIYDVICTTYAWTGDRCGGDDIDIYLYSDYFNNPILITSASLPGTLSRKFVSNITEFQPSVFILAGKDYWITYQTSSSSVYAIAIDTESNSLYNFKNTMYSGSVVGSLLSPPCLRVGGSIESNISIKCMSKNGTKHAYDISELISQYLLLMKHAQIDRLSTNMLSESRIVSNIVGELTSKGIYIKNIHTGPVEMRRRGENDLIFTIPITLDIFSEWFNDYSIDRIKDIGIEVKDIKIEDIDVKL